MLEIANRSSIVSVATPGPANSRQQLSTSSFLNVPMSEMMTSLPLAALVRRPVNVTFTLRAPATGAAGGQMAARQCATGVPSAGPP